ncbi:hypothetical protein [Planctobacterium marinum]|uniref:Uncharacterized protein n=1 Tax=Planctobacterium marinum TaxID=1631968 RepID=A0AA48KSU5_9ALTE|nr:hypothetical protein MACH26_30380 [Planctobacterium marinum]
MIILKLLLLAALISLGFWAYIELTSGENRFGSRHHPVGVIVLSGFFAVAIFIDIVLSILEPHIKKYPKLHTRLYSGFWTFLLGPVKQTDET